MREIGGYLELERYRGRMLHDDLIPLNCGRNCLAYLAELRGIRKIWLPDFLCSSVGDVCDREGVESAFYAIGADLKPVYGFEFGDEDWLYLVDYYGTLAEGDVERALDLFDGRVIVDEAQGYFREPWERADTLYTCRKFFGVADGAFLGTKDGETLGRDLPRDESHARMGFVLGRAERPASEFYAESKANNARFASEPVKRMSLITESLLAGVDYGFVKARRERNWKVLDGALGDANLLWRHVDRRVPAGPYMYPLLVNYPGEIREIMASAGVFIPMLWPNMHIPTVSESSAALYAKCILPLPVDQRYGTDDMLHLADMLVRVAGGSGRQLGDGGKGRGGVV